MEITHNLKTDHNNQCNFSYVVTQNNPNTHQKPSRNSTKITNETFLYLETYLRLQ